MKKSAVLLSHVCMVALLAGGVLTLSGCKDEEEKTKTETVSGEKASSAPKAEVSSYWDGTSDINQVAQDGSLPLIKAVNAGDLGAVNSLLQKGASASREDKNGISALEAALMKGHEEIFNTLQATEKMVLRQPKYLKAAIDGGNINLVKNILNNGGGVNATLEIKGRHRPDEELDYMDPRVVTPLKKALEENKPEIAALLLERGADGASYFFIKELTKGNLDTIKAITPAVGNLRNLSAKGMDLLTSSVGEAKPEVVQFLLEQNAGDINVALQRLLLNRTHDADYDKILDIFLKAGATPSAELLEITLTKGKTDLFEKLAMCVNEPNVKMSKGEDNLFSYAIRNNNFKAVEYLLQHGGDIWLRAKDGMTAVEFAVKNMNKQPELYQLFKTSLKNINDSGYMGESLLMILAKYGHTKEFMEVVSAGGDIWQKDHSGKTMLMYAAEGNAVDIMDYLVKKGDNVQAVDRSDKTVLMYAAENGALDAMQFLLNKRVATDDADESGKTAIMYAAAAGQAEAVSKLLDEGDSPSAMDKNRKSVLMYAVESGDLKTTETILSKGIDVLNVDKSGATTVLYAAKGGNPEIVKMLKKRNVDIYSADKNWYHPLTWALKSGNQELLDLVSGRLDIFHKETKDNNRSLALYAFDSGNPDFIRWATDKLKDNYNKKDNKGQTFVMMAVKYARPDIVRDLISRGAHILDNDNNKKSVLMYAAESEIAVNLINLLSQFSGDAGVNDKDNEGRTALMYAVGGKYNHIIKQQRLLQHGAQINRKDKYGKSVLMYAVGNPDARVENQAISELIRREADVNAKDNKGETVLMYAAANPNVGTTVTETLLNVGADIDVTDNNGKTVLMYAAESGNISKFRLLFDRGARVDGKTKDSKTVQDFANKTGKCFADAVRELIKN